MRTAKQSKTPTLDRLMAEGLVKLDETGTYTGTASDGIESYLSANPSPDKW